MALRRYKAGTIFLDVAPSFDKVQDQIRNYVEKKSGLNKAMEDEGRKAGESFAKGEAEGYRKTAQKAGDERLKQGQAINSAMVTDANKATRQMADAVERGQQAETESVEKGSKARRVIRRTEAQEAKNLERQINFAHGEALKEQARMDRAAAKEEADARAKRVQGAKDSLKKASQDAEEAHRADKQRLADFGKAFRKELRERGTLMEQMAREEQELADAMHDGAIKARERREAATAAADELHSRNTRKRMAQEEADEKAHWAEVARIETDARKQRERADKDAHTESVRRERDAARDREQVVEASGGRIGRLIRKAVSGATEDLPPIDIDADSSKADRTLNEVRRRLTKLRSVNIGVDLDAGKAMTEMSALQGMLKRVAKDQDINVRVNAMAALAKLQAVEAKINSIQREARKPILMKIFTMGGDRGGIGGDGANAFRAFNAAVLLVVTALALVGPMAAVAAAGIATLAGAALSGAGALGVLALGFQGVFSAIQDQIKAEDDLAKKAATSSSKRSTGAQQVQRAKQRLADAESNAARASEDAARRVADAERNLSSVRKSAAQDIQDAMRAEKDAQRDLSDARRDAAEQVADAMEAEKKAIRSLNDARRDAAEKVADAVQQQKDAYRNLADARRRASEQIADAVRAHADAERALADAQRQASRDIESALEQQRQAEMRVRDAQEASTRAQRDLNAARREARRDIEDLAMAYRMSKLDEKEAAIAIVQAQERLAEVRRRAYKGDASNADVQQAMIDVQQARLRAEEASKRRARAGQDTRRASRRGVEGSDRVQNAKKTARDAARAEIEAQRGVAEAAKNVARVRIDAARRIADAERGVDDASRNVAKARQEAARTISDAERQASEATKAVAAARRDGARQISDAEAAVAEASRNTAKARRDGARQVADAERAVADAARNTSQVRADAAASIADAERGVTDAIRDQKRVSEDNARSIRDAQQAITDAQAAAAESSEAMSAAAFDAQQSMADLTPAGRRFARFILGLRGEYKKLRNIAQSNMLPGLQRGLQELGIYKDGFRKFVGDMSKMWGNLFASFGKQLTNDTWRSFFHTMGQDGPKQAHLLAQAIFNVFETVAALTDAFSPLTTEMLTWLEQATAGWADWAASLKGSPAFERFLDYIREVAPVVRDFLLALGRAVIAVFVALAPFSEGVMKVLTAVLNWVADMDPKMLSFIAAGFIAIFLAIQLGNGAVALMTSLFNPLGSALSLFVALATIATLALVYFYQNNETARKYIDRMLDALKRLGGWMMDHIKGIGIFAAAIGGLVVAWKVVTAVLALRRAMKLLNLSFLASPIGWLLLGIAALVAAFIILWKENAHFRKTMIRAWNAIKKAVGAVIRWFTSGKGAGAMSAAWRAMGVALRWVYRKIIVPVLNALWALAVVVFKGVRWAINKIAVPVFRALGRIMRWVWRNVIKPVLKELNLWFKQIIAPVFRWIYKNIIKPIWNAVGRIIRAVWRDRIKPTLKLLDQIFRKLIAPVFRWIYHKIIKPIMGWIADKIGSKVKKSVNIFSGMRKFLKNTLGPAFKWFWDKVIKPVMGWIADKIKWLWDRTKPNFDKMSKGVDAVAEAFRKAKKAISRIWSNLKDVIANPIDSALRYIQTKFINNINKLLDKAGLDLRIPTIWSGSKHSGRRSPSSGRGSSTGSWKAAYASGGRVEDTETRGRVVDNVLGLSPVTKQPTAWVDHNEMVVSRRATESMDRRHPGALDYINRTGRLPGFSEGGRLPALAKGGIVALGKRLQQMGYHVSEHPKFGGVIPSAHVPNSKHRTGDALDINADSFNSKFSSEPRALDKLNKLLRAEGWHTLWRVKDHFDHLHVDTGPSGKGGGILGGIADRAMKFLTNKAAGIIDKIPGDNFIAAASKGFMKKALKGIRSKVEEEAAAYDLTEGGGAPGTGKWRGTVKKALKIVGEPASLAGITLKRMGQESGGSAGIVNRWDSNWKAGHPSVGLMQVIRGTYNAYKHPKYDKGPYKYGVSVNPLANILASMRYARSVYGSLSRAYGRSGGYAKGTDSAKPGLHWVGENGAELVDFRGGEQVYNRQQSLRMAKYASESRSGEWGGNVYVENPWTGEYLLARTRGEIKDHDAFKASVGRMNRG